jgi:hypothetical protein
VVFRTSLAVNLATINTLPVSVGDMFLSTLLGELCVNVASEIAGHPSAALQVTSRDLGKAMHVAVGCER